MTVSLVFLSRLLFVCLGHIALFVKHANDRRVRTRARAVLRVSDRVADRAGSRIPDWAKSELITDQIKAVSVLARTNLVNVLGAGEDISIGLFVTAQKFARYDLDQRRIVLFGTIGSHSAHNPIR